MLYTKPPNSRAVEGQYKILWIREAHAQLGLLCASEDLAFEKRSVVKRCSPYKLWKFSCAGALPAWHCQRVMREPIKTALSLLWSWLHRSSSELRESCGIHIVST